MLGSVEMLQCVTQALPLSARKGAGHADAQAPLLQLPHITPDVLRKVSRKKIRGVQGASAVHGMLAGASLRCVHNAMARS